MNTLSNMESNLFSQAHHCLMENDPQRKVDCTKALYAKCQSDSLERTAHKEIQRIERPGRPEHPNLVRPRELAKRSPFTDEGRAALIHSLCHIEFNAINLGLDAVYRFQDMPSDYYIDWLKVAAEEAYHFSMLHEHLQTLGYEYGDFDSHNGLWEMALDTDYDVLVRMALVPRVMEARGLDVTPGILSKLEKSKDHAAVAILEIIHKDEVGHVKIGTDWFHYLCEQRQQNSMDTFRELLNKHMKGGIHGPFALDTRKLAGFTEEELQYLESCT